MAEAADIYGMALKNGTATLMARVVGGDGSAIVQADLASAKVSVHLLDDQAPNARTAVAGHQDVALTVADLIYDTLQTDALWTVDQQGYNLRHTLDVSANPAFAAAGRRYLVEFTLTPTSGQVILVRFRIHAI